MLKLKSRKRNKKDRNGAAHPKENFYDMLGEAQLKAMRPFIGEQVKQLGQAMYLEFSKVLNVYKTRLKVLETVSGKTEDELLEVYFDVEDKASNVTKSNEAAATGDFVRLSVKEAGKEGLPRTLATDALNVAPHEIHEDLEKELVGMVAGQSKMITVKDETGKEITFETTLLRVSKKNETKKEEVAAETTPATTEAPSKAE